MECACCCEDLDDENRCLYSTDGDVWREALYCIDCARYIRSGRFWDYIKAIENSDCAKELGGLIQAGPPIWLKDDGFPVDAGDVRWIKTTDGEPETAMYDGAVTGEERQQLWDRIILVVQPCIDEQKLDLAIQKMQLEDSI